MVPGRSHGENRAAKRQRTSSATDKYDELQAVKYARRTGDVLSSPAIREALDAVLAARRVSESTRSNLEVTLKHVRASLDALPKKKTMRVDSPVVRNTLRRVAQGRTIDQLFRSDEFQDLSLVCRPPIKVNVVGSFLLGYMSAPVADIAVEVPSEVFQSKDYLNYRYHDKRLLYLTYLSRQFAKTEEDSWRGVSIATACLHGDETKPVLCVSHVDYPDVSVRLIPTYQDSVFDKGRLGGDRRNVRSAGESSVVDKASQATRFYNNSILVDSTLVSSLQFVHSVSSETPAFADTVLLLETWCKRQRLIDSKFTLAAILASVIKKGSAPARASREHLLRCALSSISAGILTELQVGGVSLSAFSDGSLLDRFAVSATTALNIIESKCAATDPWFGIMPMLFVTARGARVESRPLSTLFDGFVRIESLTDGVRPSTKDILSVLNRTFVETHRASRIEMLQPDLFGISLVSPEDMHRKVDMRREQCSVSSFKSFWGEKAGLRRFKDGKIIESLVWTGGLRTLQEMASFSFAKHIGNAVRVRVIIGELEEASGYDFRDAANSGRAMTAFNELATLLRSLEGLPLSIRAVHATSAYLRRCGLNACEIRPHQASFCHPLDIVASFETSAAWPDDPVAISAAKAAFYVALKTSLAGKGLHARATISFLDITLAGFVFRLRIRVDKEKEFLSYDSEDHDALVWETETRVRHQEKIQHLNNPLMGSVTRLAKKWLNRHLLLSQMGSRGEELVETLVASVVSRPEVLKSSSVMGYFCQFLHLLAEFPWEVCPMAVFLEENDASTDEKDNGEAISELERFRQCVLERFSEKSDGKMPFAVYNGWNAHKDDAETWFARQHAPEQVIVDRIVATAVSSLSFIEDYITEMRDGVMLRTIFATPTDRYDVILKLDNHLCPFGKGAARCGPFKAGKTPLVGLNPVHLLRHELEARLGDYAVFLTEQTGRSQIFVIWRPLSQKAVKFSLRDAPFRKPIADERSLQPNPEELVSAMQMIGNELIVDICFPKAVDT